MAQLLIDMLAEFGTDAQLVRTAADDSVTTQTIRCVFVDPQTSRIRPLELDGNWFRLVADSNVQILESDTIKHPVRGSFFVNRVDPICPADKILGYKVEGKTN